MASAAAAASSVTRTRASRRALLRSGLAGVVLWRLGLPTARAAPSSTPAKPGQPDRPTDPGTWRTWLLTSGDELRPAPPAAPSAAELDELRGLQGRRTAETARTVEAWGPAPAVLPWTDLALDLIRAHRPSPVRAARALALLHTALADTVVATWDARAASSRPAPAALAPEIVPLGTGDSGGSSYPSEHAAVAEAAVAVLAYLFPDEPADGLTKLADEAATSRLWAGTNFRSDVEAGRKLGRAVGDRAVARGKADGSAAVWDGTGRPTGDGTWQPTPPAFVQQPLDPTAGTWTTWVVASGNQYRPSPPPIYRSPAWQAELAAVQEAVARRTSAQEGVVRFWAGGPGTATPGGLWTQIARDLVVRDGLDLPHAARALALLAVAMADAFVCCWDAKYAYWTERPITADPTLDVLIPTPPFPSYTSGHATVSAAAATVLGHLFPDDEADLAARAEQAKQSRLWAGIHFPLDNDMGAVGGHLVGRLVVLRARADGAEG